LFNLFKVFLGKRIRNKMKFGPKGKERGTPQIEFPWGESLLNKAAGKTKVQSVFSSSQREKEKSWK
jgi:hypothetical protein